MSNSSTTTDTDLIEPIHPGEILMEDFIKDFGITQSRLAAAIEMSYVCKHHGIPTGFQVMSANAMAYPEYPYCTFLCSWPPAAAS